MQKSSAIEDLKDKIISENLTPELKDGATQLVMGEGNLNARIVFIGEAPGKKEDLQGKPFVGASGRFLDTMLDSIGLNREDVYITNIVKYRPPDNRDPSRSEKDAFYDYLVEQLAIIRPKLIVTLGRHSLNMFLPELIIGDVHGQILTISIKNRDVVILPLYHPAAAMYNGSLRQVLESDFKNIHKALLT